MSISKVNVSSTEHQIVGSPRYATCSTAAETAAKVASIADESSTFVLERGVRICVKFTNANSVANPTLNVGSTGAKAIYWHGAALASSQYWQAGAVVDFVYNGTQWELVGVAKDNNTTYSVATSSVNGLMSSDDKTKLDGIATGANKTTVDSSLSSTSTNPVQNKVVNSALNNKLSLSGGTLSGNLTLQKSVYITSESGTRAIFFQNSDGTQHNIALVGNDGSQDIAFRIINDNNADDKKYVFAYNDSTDTITMRPAVSCGTSLSVSGNIAGQYITGTWLQTTAATDLGKATEKVAVLDGSGWVYYRTPAELVSDMGVVTPADYVVEQGTSSSWTYQKWNSGIIKAWKKTTSSNLGATGQINSWYYRSYSVTIPSGLLTSVTSAMCNCKWGTGVSFASAQEVTTTSFGAVYFSNQNGGAGTFYHEVTGTWK